MSVIFWPQTTVFWALEKFFTLSAHEFQSRLRPCTQTHVEHLGETFEETKSLRRIFKDICVKANILV
jgi:hypothetical protein